MDTHAGGRYTGGMERTRVGFACVPRDLPDAGQRTCRLARATPARLRELIAANIATVDRCLDYAAGLGFGLFRVSSDLVPFGSHPVNKLRWWREFEPELLGLGLKARRLDLRLSTHPGQYTLLSSPSPKTTAAAVADLLYHARLLDAMGLPTSDKIVIHLGGVYGDKAAALARFAYQYKRLPQRVRSRLVIENDERCYGALDVLAAGRTLGIPVVFDRFHHRVAGGASGAAIGRILRRARNTWTVMDGPMKVHFSSQAPGLRPGAHGDSIDPAELESFLDEARGVDFDVMIESKGKERAALVALEIIRRRRRQ